MKNEIPLSNFLIVLAFAFNVLEFYGAMVVGGDWIFIVGTTAILLGISLFIKAFRYALIVKNTNIKNEQIKNNQS